MAVQLTPEEELKSKLAQFATPAGLAPAPSAVPQSQQTEESLSVETVLPAHLTPTPKPSDTVEPTQTDWRQWITMAAPLVTGLISGGRSGLNAGVKVGAEAAMAEVDRRDKIQEKEREKQSSLEKTLAEIKLRQSMKKETAAKDQYLQIVGEDGRPQYIKSSEYAGQTLFNPKMLTEPKDGKGKSAMKPSETVRTHKSLMEPYVQEMKNLQAATVEHRNVQEALRMGDPTAEVTAVMQFLRVVDPQSVARESEVQSVLGARDRVEAFDMLSEILTGKKKLTASQAKTIGLLSDKLLQNRIDAWEQVSKPNIVRAGRAAGVEDFSFLPDYSSSLKKYAPMEGKQAAQGAQKERRIGPRPPSEKVTVTYKGKTLIIPRSDLAAAQKDGAKLVGE